MSETEYLRFEHAAEERHEYLDGKILSVPSESGDHADIHANLIYRLASQLQDAPYRVRAGRTKVRSGPTRKSGKRPCALYSYPDVAVIPEKPQYFDKDEDVVLDPMVIVAVLSKSTEALDRGVKFMRYQEHNPTLIDYVLVSQDQPQIEHYRRLADGGWTYRRHAGLKATVKIESIGCKLKANQIYHRIVFSRFADGRNTIR